MKIYIIGCSGFLGKYISNKLSKKYIIKEINLREIHNFNKGNYELFLNKFNEANLIINCAASLKPKSKKDFFINQDFPKILDDYIKKINNKCTIIHISTINVLINDRKDPYSISKRIAEKKLINTNTIILRLPLLLDRKDGYIENSGSLSFFYKYLNLKFLPIYPMIFPGHTVELLEVNKIANFIDTVLINSNNSKKIYNLSNGNKVKLWDLFEEIANKNNKKIYKINFSKFTNIMPNFFIEFLKKKSNFLQQLVDIDNTKHLEEKTIL